MNQSRDASAVMADLKADMVRYEQLQGLQGLEDDYASIDSFLQTLTAVMTGDASTVFAERVHTSWCRHIITNRATLEDSRPFRPPPDQHTALMYLHYVAQDLEAYAIDAEAKLSRAVARDMVPAASALLPTPSDPNAAALMQRLDEATRLSVMYPDCARLHGQELAAAVDSTRAEVGKWHAERASLQERIVALESELEKLRDGEVATPLSVDLEDLNRAATYKKIRTERMQIESQCDTLRRILCLPLR